MPFVKGSPASTTTGRTGAHYVKATLSGSRGSSPCNITVPQPAGVSLPVTSYRIGAKPKFPVLLSRVPIWQSCHKIYKRFLLAKNLHLLMKIPKPDSRSPMSTHMGHFPDAGTAKLISKQQCLGARVQESSDHLCNSK